MRCLPSTIAVLSIALLWSNEARGQGSNAPPPQMEVLERLVGTWKVDHIGRIPKEAPFTGVVKRELVLGGRFVQEMGNFEDEGKGSHTSMYTYDANRNEYRYWFFHSSGFYSESTGTWDKNRERFTFTSDLGGRGMGVTSVDFIDENTFDWSVVSKDAAGRVVFHMEGKAVRQE